MNSDQINMKDSELSDTSGLVRKVVESQYFAVLGSDDKGKPYTNLVAFAASPDLKYLVFITSRNTHKYRNLIQNSQVCLLIDNRANSSKDINKAIAVTALGSAHEEVGRESGLYSIFVQRHPYLIRFASDKDSAIIAVAVSEYIVAGFEKTQMIVIRN